MRLKGKLGSEVIFIMTDRRSQYEGIDDSETINFTIPLEETRETVPLSPPKSPATRRAPPPPVMQETTVQSPPKTTSSPGSAPSKTVTPQSAPQSSKIDMEERDPTRMNDIVKVRLTNVQGRELDFKTCKVTKKSFDIVYI